MADEPPPKRSRIRTVAIICAVLVSVGVILVPAIWYVLSFPEDLFTVTSSEALPPVVFSPDSQTVAYVWIQRRWHSSGEGRKPLTVSYKSRLRWFPVNSLSQEQSVDLDFMDPSPKGEFYFSQPVEIQFSPDSRYLAAASPHGLTLVDLRNGVSAKWMFPGEKASSSLAWISPDEVVYSTHTKTTQTFWRQKVAPGAKRILVYQAPDNSDFSSVMWSDEDDWSPNGKFAVINNTKLLDVEARAVTPLSGRAWYLAWKPDSSAFIVQYYDGWDKPYRYELIDPRNGHVTDLTAQFNKVFKYCYFITTRIHTDLLYCSHLYNTNGWTADGRYLAVQDNEETPAADSRTWLVSFEPFERRRMPDPSLRTLPVPGLVLSGQRGVYYATDYKGEHQKDLGYSIYWVFSPDVKRAAAIEDGKMVIHDIDLPKVAPCLEAVSKPVQL